MGEMTPCLRSAFAVLHLGCANVYVRASNLAPVYRSNEMKYSAYTTPCGLLSIWATLRIHIFIMTSSTFSAVTGPLWGEFAGHRRIPLTKALTRASDAELWCFLWSALETNGWVNNRDAGELRRHRTHYDVTVMLVKGLVPNSTSTFKWPCYYIIPHDDVIKWKHLPRFWPFVRGIHRCPVNSPHKGQWRGALMFSLICAWITIE